MDELKRLAEEFALDYAPDDRTGAFYALITITNSNDLSSIGDAENREVIPGTMWFVSQADDTPTRQYLVKLCAARRTVLPDAVTFTASADGNGLSASFTNAGKQIAAASISLAKNEEGVFAGNQRTALSAGKYASFDLSDISANGKLQSGLEDALADLGFAMEAGGVTFDEPTQELAFSVVPFDEASIQIGFAHSVGAMLLQYAVNGVHESPKYAIGYHLDKTPEGCSLSLAFDRKPTAAMLAHYIMPFKKQIEAELQKQINAAQTDVVVSDLQIDFETMSSQANFTALDGGANGAEIPDGEVAYPD